MTSLSREPEANVRSVYEQLCYTYRSIDDFRAKLLGFLPVVTGGGLLFLTGKGELPNALFLPAGLFGLVVTLGLFAYEIYGIAKCHDLIVSGQALESSLGVSAGQFQGRPREVLGHINEPFAAAIIYPSVMAAWGFLALLQISRVASWVVAAVMFCAGCAVTLRYNIVLRRKAGSVPSPWCRRGRRDNAPLRRSV